MCMCMFSCWCMLTLRVSEISADVDAHTGTFTELVTTQIMSIFCYTLLSLLKKIYHTGCKITTGI